MKRVLRVPVFWEMAVWVVGFRATGSSLGAGGFVTLPTSPVLDIFPWVPLLPPFILPTPRFPP